MKYMIIKWAILGLLITIFFGACGKPLEVSNSVGTCACPIGYITYGWTTKCQQVSGDETAEHLIDCQVTR